MVIFFTLFPLIVAWIMVQLPDTFLLSFWLIAMVFMLAIQDYIRTNVVQEAYKIVSTSMSPRVLKGDYVLVDKTAYDKEPVARGGIIIYVFPDDRSKDFIRQVVALPGDEISSAKGEFVAHGKVLVIGPAQSGKVLDSDSYGLVDMRDIVGKVKQIYFSKEEHGIRWRRIRRLLSL